MDSPSAPQTPDPALVAGLQYKYNRLAGQDSAQLNRPTQNTPYGSQSWTQDPATFDQAGFDKATADWTAAGGTGTAPSRDQFSTPSNNFTSNITLDPRVQSLVDAQLGRSTDLTGATHDAAARMAGVYGQAVDPNVSRDARANYSQGNDIAASVYGQFDPIHSQISNIDNSLSHQNTADPSQAINVAKGLNTGAGSLLDQQMSRLSGQSPLSYGGAPGMPTADQSTRQRVEDALYNRQTSRLDPQFQQQESDIRSRLMNQGVLEGSDAWKREMDNFGRTRNDAYSSARDDSITMGGNEMAQQFGLGMSARQQGVGEANTLHQSPYADASNLAGLYGSTGSQLDSHYGVQNQAQQIQNQADATRLQAQQQQMAALAQQMGVANYFQTSGNNLGNLDRNQLAATMGVRDQMGQEYAGLNGQTQPILPNFGPGNSGASIGSPNYAGAVGQQYQGQLNAYNTGVGANNSFMNGLAGIGGSAMMAPAGTFSFLGAGGAGAGAAAAGGIGGLGAADLLPLLALA